MNSVKKFDYAISNPPYQLDTQSDTASRRTTTDVYPMFHSQTSFMSNKVAMIYPATWQKSLTKGLGKFLIDNGLYSSDTYNGTNLFPKIRKNFNISVVISEHDYKKDYFVNGSLRDRELDVFISDDKKQLLYNKTRDMKKLYGAYYPNNLANVETSGLNFSLTKDSTIIDPISVYIKKRPGMQADGAVHWIERKELETVMDNPQLLDEYNVSIQSRVVGRMHVLNEDMLTIGNVGAKVYNKGETHSTTWIILRSFDNLSEAQNFAKYVNCDVFSQLIGLDHVKKSFASYVPDLVDYSNDNPYVNWNEPLEHQLYELFEMTDEEIEFLERN